VDGDGGGEQRKCEEERGGKVGHLLSPRLSTTAERAGAGFDPYHFVQQRCSCFVQLSTVDFSSRLA
jgi:hypothetical protein